MLAMIFARSREAGVRQARAGLQRSDKLGASMLGTALGAVLAGGLLLAAAPAFAQGGCSRDSLQTAAENYVAAQAAGDPFKMHMGLWVDYNEQLQNASMSTGVLSKPQKIDFHRNLLDTATCKTFTEMVITDPAHPYVIGTVVSVGGMGGPGEVGGISSVVTDKANGWLFTPANTMKYSQAENWSEIPAAERDSRDTIVAAANAYLDLFNDKNVKVPWGAPCERLEGGLYTGKGAPGVSLPDDSCNVGVPSGVKIVNRAYVVDEALGAVAVVSNFGAGASPDVHTFRVEKGKIRYVHTITACSTANCGLKLSPEILARLGG
jgi:hypothetical protein